MSVPYKLLHLFFFSFLVFCFAGIAFAQETEPVEEEIYVPTPEELEELELMYEGWEGGPEEQDENRVSCLDYYTFQSVQVSLEADKSTYTPGETVNLSGFLVNENDHPVTNGNVFVRVSKLNDSMGDGNYIRDEFFALEDVSLRANDEKYAEAQWTVPQGLTAGEYKMDFFFSVGKKFNLGGLPFSNEVTIGSISFSIETENTTGVSFERSNTEVNGEPYAHIGDWPIIDAGEEVTVTQPIRNTAAEDITVNVSYDLYYWDSLLEEDLINTKTESVTIPAEGNAVLEYMTPAMDETVYYLKITADTGNYKSIVNIRMGSEQERPRINYPAITKFPVEANDEFTLFSCFHNTSYTDTEGRLLVTLKDETGVEVGRVEYDGMIASAMSANKVDLVAQDDYEYLELDAQMYNADGELVDSYRTVYDCNNFGNCKPEQEVVEPSPDKSSPDQFYLLVLLIVVSVILLIIIGVVLVRKKHQHAQQPEGQQEEQIS